MAARKPPTPHTYLVGFYKGPSTKIHEIEIRGHNTNWDAEGELGLFEILDVAERPVFSIPHSSLVYCYVKAAQPRPKTLKPHAVLPLRAIGIS